jgi:hypothetical protein
MEDKKAEAVTELKPGETIHPGQDSAPAKSPEPTATPAAVETEAGILPVVEPAQTNEIPTGLQPSGGEQDADPDQVTWTASEYIEHTKSFNWYLALVVVGVLAAVLLYVLFRDIITAATPLVAALVLGFYGRRRPRQLQYRLDSQGLTIGPKFFPYSQFRSFAVMEDGAFASIAFLPMKRFGMLTTVYLDPEDEDAIIGLLNQYLPLEPREHDAVDRFMKRIRF